MNKKTDALHRLTPFLKAFFGLSLALFLCAGCSSRIVQVSDMSEVKMPELVDKMRQADMVFVGELHTNKWHHQVQLNVIKALNEAGVPLSIGMEMFTAENQDKLDKWTSGEMDINEFVRFYYVSWRLPWPNYRDILIYARENKIPVVGLNVSRKIIHQVFTKGYSSLTPEQMSELPPGIECKVDAEYEQFIKEAMEDHDTSPEGFKKFCEAQMVWDNAMAHNAIEYLKENPGKKMVVIAGSGHSWRRGIPAQVSRLSGYSSVVILPEAHYRLNMETVTAKDTDYLWVGSLMDAIN